MVFIMGDSNAGMNLVDLAFEASPAWTLEELQFLVRTHNSLIFQHQRLLLEKT